MTTTRIRLAAAVAVLAAAVSVARAASDPFGVAEIYPTVSGGVEWYSKWTGAARTFTGVDPYDAWFDAAHGVGTYVVDGHGLFKISGSTPRMYIHDPAKSQQWHNVELTVYAMRVADDNTPYAGIVGVTRTNHGTTGEELSNLCDTRGYGGRLRNDGYADFDKETRHPNTSEASRQPVFAGGLPKNVWLGYKHLTYDLPNGNVMNELWLDKTDGLNGGSWVKIDSFEDNGSNFGVGGAACASGINPALKLTVWSRAGSESGKPNVSVYWRATNVGANGMIYKKMSVREIAAGSTAAPPPPTASAPIVTSVVASGLTQSGATISWSTDKISHSQVEYGVTTAYGAVSGQSTATGLYHGVSLSGLQAGTLYHYRARSFDDATGLAGLSSDYTFTTAQSAPNDVISMVQATNVTTSGATILWNTTLVSHSQVEYGLTSGYGSQSGQSTATGVYHSMPLAGLKAGVVYHYRVKSLDAYGRTAVSGDYTFKT